MAHKILLVEDEANLANAILLNLKLEGYTATWIKNGKTANATLLSKPKNFDLVILDVMLPEKDGFEICKNFRNAGNDTPILFLSARNSGKDKITGLRLGADDYLGKPFHLEELLLRVRKLIRLGQGKGRSMASTRIDFHANCWIDFATYTIKTQAGEERSISKREALLLRLLASKSGEVVSREEILEVVWGYSAFPSTRTIDNYILAFRKYFEPDPKNPKFFLSARGVGYRFESV